MALSDGSRTWVLLNDCTADKPLADEFTIFSKFPTEIAMKIWKYVLHRNRLIGISVIENTCNTDGSDAESPPLPVQKVYTLKNALGNIITGPEYHLRITTVHKLSPLFRVNRQSRQAALEFYRVHIPHNLTTESEILHLNPEYDFLHIQNEGAPEIFASFVHDVKAYDPLGVGILHMVYGQYETERMQLPLRMTST